jgi:hypothetical protein
LYGQVWVATVCGYSVAVGPLVVTGLANKGFSDPPGVLAAAVKGDVNPAACTAGTGSRYIQVSGVGQAALSWVPGDELALLKGEDTPARCAAGRRCEPTVDVLQQGTGTIVITVIDEGAAGGGAAIAEVRRDLRMTGLHVVPIIEVAGIGEVVIVGVQGIHGLLLDHPVVVTREEPNLVVGEVGRVVDGPAAKGQASVLYR